MKKVFALSLALLLICLASLVTIHPVQAGISGTPTWVKPAWVWKNVQDPFLGTFSVAYIAGSKWNLNVWIYNDATNSTDAFIEEKEKMSARIYRIAVWFDWNRFYNTTLDVTMKYGEIRLFTINGTTEETSIASNLFTHNYKIYVEYRISYQKGGTITQEKTWATNEVSGFAVLSQQQYDSALADVNFWSYYFDVDDFCLSYAESSVLMYQGNYEAGVALNYYRRGEFSDALQHYNNASSLVDRALSSYKSKRATYEANTGTSMLDRSIDRYLAETEYLRANATVATTMARAAAIATMVNSFAFMFFGLGFIVFGVAAIFYAHRRKQI